MRTLATAREDDGTSREPREARVPVVTHDRWAWDGVRPGGRRERVSYRDRVARASGGIGRRAGFRFLCPKGCGGSSPPSPTPRLPARLPARSAPAPSLGGLRDGPLRGCLRTVAEFR